MSGKKSTNSSTPIKGSLIPSSEALGLMIKSVRLKKNMTQADLAKLANTRVATVSQAEKGKVRLETIFKLLFSLDLTMEIKPLEIPEDDKFSLFLD